jgi:hypothetical protein
MAVDEARRNDRALSVDLGFAIAFEIRTDLDDDAIAHAHVGARCFGCAGAVDDASAPNQEVSGHATDPTDVLRYF